MVSDSWYPFYIMKFSKQNLADIPIEQAHGGSGSRQMLLNAQVLASSKWEAVTKGFLPAGASFDWHKHEDIDELFLVTKGNGKFYCEDDVVEYEMGDVISVSANTVHKIENTGKETTEGFFIRIKI